MSVPFLESAKSAVMQVGAGRGFIVSAGESRYILSAAHCLPRSRFPRPHLANGVAELTFPRIIGPLASKQRMIWAELCAISLTDDFAVFSEPDRQELSDQCEQYEQFTAAALVIGKPPAAVEPYKWRTTPATAAWVLSLDCEWQPCTVHNGGRFLSVQKGSDGINSGMSGSPIIDASGAAIGLISTSGDIIGGGFPMSMNPSLMDCLPPWLLRKLNVMETHMTDAEIETASTRLNADQTALRMCVVQLITDRMRDQKDMEAARQMLRAFDNDVHGLLAAVPIGSLVQMLAVEQLAKLMETVRALLEQK